MQTQQHNLAVAHSWYAIYSDMHGSENIILEVRHTPTRGFLLHTKIREVEHHIYDTKFLYGLETLLSRLPYDASICISHPTIIYQDSSDSLVTIDETILPYRAENNVDPAYQLRLIINDQAYSTRPLPDTMASLEWLVSLLPPRTHFKVCGFCELMFDNGIYGGTDGRHDLLYCFRDNRKALEELRNLPLKSPVFPNSLLSLGLQDIDVFHTCSSFQLAANYEERIGRAKCRLSTK